MWERIGNIDWEFVFIGVVMTLTIAFVIVGGVALVANIPYANSHRAIIVPELQPTIEYLSTQIAILKGR